MVAMCREKKTGKNSKISQKQNTLTENKAEVETPMFAYQYVNVSCTETRLPPKRSNPNKLQTTIG